MQKKISIKLFIVNLDLLDNVFIYNILYFFYFNEKKIKALMLN